MKKIFITPFLLFFILILITVSIANAQTEDFYILSKHKSNEGIGFYLLPNEDINRCYNSIEIINPYNKTLNIRLERGNETIEYNTNNTKYNFTVKNDDKLYINNISFGKLRVFGKSQTWGDQKEKDFIELTKSEFRNNNQKIFAGAIFGSIFISFGSFFYVKHKKNKEIEIKPLFDDSGFFGD